MNRLAPTWLALLFFVAPAGAATQKEVLGPLVAVGFARTDITPAGPIRLAGYGNRTVETAEVRRPLTARALAIGEDGGPGKGASQPAVLITVELIGISAAVSDAVADYLLAHHGIDRAHLAVCATHIHTGPMLDGVLSSMFPVDLPPDQVARIRSYTETLTAKLDALADAALADRKPGRLAWSQGSVSFASSRRIIRDGKWVGFGLDLDGSADRALPLLRVTSPEGALRGVFVSYACHNTTWRSSDNFIDPDWGGDAARRIEEEHPGSTALVGLGCAGDADPAPFGRAEYVAEHGLAVATEVDRLLQLPLAPLGAVSAAEFQRMPLPLDHQVSREELAGRLASRNGAVRANAERWIKRLDAGESAPSQVPFAVQYWTFGPQLAMVFFTGELVSDYSLRLKRELDGDRLWVNAYANGLPCYVASTRMFPEDGYEVSGSMELYGWPTHLDPTVEDLIVKKVHHLLPPGWERPAPSP